MESYQANTRETRLRQAIRALGLTPKPHHIARPQTTARSATALKGKNANRGTEWDNHQSSPKYGSPQHSCVAAARHSRRGDTPISRDRSCVNPQLETRQNPERVPMSGPVRPIYFVAKMLTAAFKTVEDT